MTIFPFQLNEVVHLYNRISKINPSTILEREPEPRDIINISAEAKKRQIMEQTRGEILEKIRKFE